MNHSSNSLKSWVTIGTLEGISFLLLLFIAVPIKYLLEFPIGVRILGPIHGSLFIVYIVYSIKLLRQYRWPFSWFVYIFIGAILPFGPFIVDSWIVKKHQKVLTH